jgi:hypothetical protein
MLVLESNQVCPYGSFCKYSVDFENNKCAGLDINRNNVFVCKLWAENYSKKELESVEICN